MTVWERIDVLKDRGSDPTVLYQNWGKNLENLEFELDTPTEDVDEFEEII